MRLMTTLSAAAALMATQAVALDLDAMSDAERTAFRAEVRAYLLANPEVLMEAIGVLEARQEQAEALRDEQLAQLNANALLNDGHSYEGGNPDGDITIVEFVDYRCGFCRRAHPEVARSSPKNTPSWANNRFSPLALPWPPKSSRAMRPTSRCRTL